MQVANRPIERTLRPNVSPAAGSEFAFIPNKGGGWLIRTLRFLLTTNATVANREVTLTVSDGTDVYAQFAATSVQAASLAIAYGAFPGAARASELITFKSIDWPAGGLWLPQGHTLSSATSNLNGADAYTLIRARAIDYPSGAERLLWPLEAGQPAPPELT